MNLQTVQSQAHKHSLPRKLHVADTYVVYGLWESQKKKHMAKNF